MARQSFTAEQFVRAVQSFTRMMVLGVLLFAAMAVFVLGTLNDPPDGVVFSTFAAGISAIAFVLHFSIPDQLVRRGAAKAGKQKLYGAYLAKTIIGLGLLEGAAFINIIATLFEHNWWSLAIAGGLVFWMLAMFPTRTRVDQWVETQQMLNQTDG